MAVFRFEVLGRKLAVECERSGKRLVVRSGGKELVFLPEFIGDHLVQLRFDGRVVPAWVVLDEHGVHVSVEGETYYFDRENGEGDARRPAEGDRLAPGAHTLRAPMPGTVAKVLVEEEALAEEGEPLVVVEAMKMENSIRAPAVCRIARVFVREGDVVNPGDPLLEVVV